MLLLDKIKNKLGINYRKKRWPGLINAYKQYLPVTKKTPIISLNEGNTPLILSDSISKLVYSEIGNVFLSRLSSILHPPNTTDERTGMLALRSSVVKGIDLGDGKINLINFFEGYPTKTVILNVNALSKVMNKVESITELLDFFTNSPLEKIKSN